MDEILVPDIAGWKRETLPLLPRAAFMSVPPDWVCEVLSEGTTRHDRRVKTRIYHRWGVRWLWLVDPRENVIEAYRREGPFWVRLGDWADDERARIEPFEAVELELEHVWEGFGE